MLLPTWYHKYPRRRGDLIFCLFAAAILLGGLYYNLKDAVLCLYLCIKQLVLALYYIILRLGWAYQSVLYVLKLGKVGSLW